MLLTSDLDSDGIFFHNGGCLLLALALMYGCFERSSPLALGPDCLIPACANKRVVVLED